MTNDSKAPQPSGNYYDLLEVTPHASQEVIQAAYRALVRSCHPDVNASEGAARRIVQLNAAYHVLGDTERRAQYDLRRMRSSRTTTQPIPTPSTASRGRPHPKSPKRIEDQRAAPIATASSSWAPGFPRLFLGVLIVVILAGALAIAAWLVSDFANDDPSSYMSTKLAETTIDGRSAHDVPADFGPFDAAQPFVNRG